MIEDLLGGIKKGLTSDQAKDIIYELMKPARYTVTLLFLILFVTFILNISNIYLTYKACRILEGMSKG